MRKSYVGITGFTDRSEVNSVLGAISDIKTDRLLMVGVLASFKTLKGGKNDWKPNRYPRVDVIEAIFPNNPMVMNIVHYYTTMPETLFEQLQALTMRGGSHMHGLQLNNAWPNPRILEKYRKMYSEKTIILPITSGAIEDVVSEKQLAERIKTEYNGLCDYILLDPSSGIGRSFDPVLARKQLEALSAKNLNIGFAVAGGICASTLHLVEEILKDFPNVSFDMEGKVRTPAPEDALNVSEACNSAIASFKLCGN